MTCAKVHQGEGLRRSYFSFCIQKYFRFELIWVGIETGLIVSGNCLSINNGSFFNGYFNIWTDSKPVVFNRLARKYPIRCAVHPQSFQNSSLEERAVFECFLSIKDQKQRDMSFEQMPTITHTTL